MRYKVLIDALDSDIWRIKYGVDWGYDRRGSEP